MCSLPRLFALVNAGLEDGDDGAKGVRQNGGFLIAIHACSSLSLVRERYRALDITARRMLLMRVEYPFPYCCSQS